MIKDSINVVLFEENLNEQALSDNAVKMYSKVAKIFSKQHGEPNEKNVRQFIIDKVYRPGRRSNSYYYGLKKYLKFLKQSSLMDNLKYPKAKTKKSRRVYLDTEARMQLINNLSEGKHKIIATIQMLTGARYSDIARMKRGDITPEVYQDMPIIRFYFKGKGDKDYQKIIIKNDINKWIWSFICDSFNRGDYYFLDSASKRLPPEQKLLDSNFNRYWHDIKRALQTIGIDHKTFASHDFRRSIARDYYFANDKDISKLKSFLNHNSIATSLLYIDEYNDNPSNYTDLY